MEKVPSDFKYLLDKLRSLLIKDINLNGRKVTGASRSSQESDYVTRGELVAILNGSTDGAASSYGNVLEDSPIFNSVVSLHALAHQSGGDDEINVENLFGELSDLQKPKLIYDTDLKSFIISDWIEYP